MPLSTDQLSTYLKAGNLFENELNLSDTGRVIAREVAEMVEKFTLPKIKAASDETFLYITFWIVIDKTRKEIVAELGFKGAPNEKGEIEIGYGTMPGSRSRGYMTEAVGGMVNWAMGKKEIKAILAETNNQNLASMKVLENNGFSIFEKKGKMLWWKKLVN